MLEREAFLVFRGFLSRQIQSNFWRSCLVGVWGGCISIFSCLTMGNLLFVVRFVILAFLLCVSVFFPPLSTHPSFFFVVIQVNQPRFVYKCLCVCLFNWSHNTNILLSPALCDSI
ncbi:hypothetical protein F5883DRAFT_43335 [Diaporthe sp. PMI_573]|nr:hypothetical protein F5883DRAFT_43335 [Diaporthaceae sp. PMI_573]